VGRAGQSGARRRSGRRKVRRDHACGERPFLRWVRSQLTPLPKSVVVGPGDDVAILRPRGGAPVGLTIDTLLEGTHFDLTKVSARAVGYKAMAVNLSDIAAVAMRPSWAVVSVALSRATTMRAAKELLRGMADAARPFGVGIVGGDTTSWDGPLAITVALAGESTGRKPVLRSGARPGDLIWVTGTLGGSLLRKHTAFKPRVREALKLNASFVLHSMIDVSDGLSVDLSHIAEESGVGAEIDEDSVPISANARKLAAKTDQAPIDHALNDGEDFELLFTLSPAQSRKLDKARTSLGFPLTRIGRIIPEGYYLVDRHGRRRPFKVGGYEHRWNSNR